MLKLLMICAWIASICFWVGTIYNIELSLIYADDEEVPNEVWDELGERIEWYVGPSIIGLIFSLAVTIAYIIVTYVI